jgi:gas vesicle protein
MSDRDSGNSFMWFLAGLGFGALMGVLYAPRSGRETREAILNSAQEGKDYIKNRSREARESVGEWVDRSKEVINRQKDQFSSAIDAGRQAYREASSGEGKKS